MTHTCTKCSRVNPPEAHYCYYDGAVLNGHGVLATGPVNTGTQAFSHAFVFPSGDSCNNFDQLVLTIYKNWKEAIGLLKQGDLAAFLSSLGRADLAAAARESARFPDKDRGLDMLLDKLPSQALSEARLLINPTEVNLGQLKVGEDRTLELHFENQGMRLVYGTVTADKNSLWLSPGEAGTSQKMFQFGPELIMPIHIVGKKLRASSKPVEGILMVECNGGNALVTVRCEVPPKPFPEGVLAGAKNPRQVADKAKTNPKDAAPLFEKGAVAQWYKDNGWVYPVRGPSASGLGAVQQFFEALGLTPPPKVEISDKQIAFEGAPGDTLRHKIEVKTLEKRPVYAHAISDQPWLEVGKPLLNGRTATISLTVPRIPDKPGERLTAKLKVLANGNQRFMVPVTLAIGASLDFTSPSAPAPAAEVSDFPLAEASDFPLAEEEEEKKAPEPTAKRPEAPPPPPPRRTMGDFKVGIHAVPAAVLAAALLGIMVWDFASPQSGGSSIYVPPGGEREKWDLIDTEPRVEVDFRDNQRFGIVLAKETDPNRKGDRKKLTFFQDGASNNTCVRIDGQYEYLFGDAPPGRWVRGQKGVSIVDPVNHGREYRSAMEWPNEKIRVTQYVAVVMGQQSRLLDTVRVKYVVENYGTLQHKFGLRVLLDTFIGSNDGVPFLIPGRETRVDSKEIITSKGMPDYIEALEKNDIKDPGTVAQIGLKVAGAEDPIKLVICRHPEIKHGFNAKWEWEIMAMNEPAGASPDSCVVIYWPEEMLKSGETRTMAYTYGLGTVTSAGGGEGKVALSLGGQFQPGRTFTVTAYVKDATDGQKLTLRLPAQVELEEDEQATKAITPEPGKGVSQVSWRVRAKEVGEFKIEVSLTDGAGRTLGTTPYSVRIRRASLFN